MKSPQNRINSIKPPFKGAGRAKEWAIHAVMHPIFIVGGMTVLPYLMLLPDITSRLTFQLSREVTVGAPYFFYAFACALAFATAFLFASRTRLIGRAPNTAAALERRDRGLTLQSAWRAVWIGGAVCIAGVVLTILILGTQYARDVSQVVASGSGALQQPDVLTEYRRTETLMHVPGYVKMFSYSALSGAVLAIVGFRTIARDAKVLEFAIAALMLIAAVSGVVYRCLLIGDRWPIVGISIAFVLSNVGPNQGGRRRLQGWRKAGMYLGAGIAALLLIAGKVAIEELRGREVSAGSAFLTYIDLGFANSVLAVDTSRQLCFGFETLLHPLKFIIRALNIDVDIPYSDARWTVNPAGTLLAYSFYDLRFFGWIVYAVVGWVVGWAYAAYWKRSSILSTVVYCYVLLAVMSIATVPLFRGPEFWAGLGVVVVGAKIADRRTVAIHTRFEDRSGGTGRGRKSAAMGSSERFSE